MRRSPHISDPGQANQDGDGAGDACDPQPTTPGETIAFFDPFTSQRSDWSSSQQPLFMNDQLVFDARGTSLERHAADRTDHRRFAARYRTRVLPLQQAGESQHSGGVQQ